MLVRNNKVLKLHNTWLKPATGFDPYNPLGLPPLTIRVRFIGNSVYNIMVYPNGDSYATKTLVEVREDDTAVVDVTIRNTVLNSQDAGDWSGLFINGGNIVEVLGINSKGDGTGWTTDVLTMDGMFMNCTLLINVNSFKVAPIASALFYGCHDITTLPMLDMSEVNNASAMFMHCFNLTTVPLFDTSNIIYMNNMFQHCNSLTSIPLFNTSSCAGMNQMFYDCYNVEHGALALYQQASTQANPPLEHAATFGYCGVQTQTGLAEFEQIPADWK